MHRLTHVNSNPFSLAHSFLATLVIFYVILNILGTLLLQSICTCYALFLQHHSLKHLSLSSHFLKI